MHAAVNQPPPPRSARNDRARMVECLRRLFEMDERSFRIVRWRFLHPNTPLSKIAKRFRVSTQSVHQRLQAVAEQWPPVRELVGLRLKRK